MEVNEWMVTRDGVQVSPLLETENAAWLWLLNHQSQSVAWAMRHEGYDILPLELGKVG